MALSSLPNMLLPRQSTGSDAADTILQLLSNPFQFAFQINAFWASLGTSLGFSALLALVFSLLRPRHNVVYAPKIKYADAMHAPPRIGKGIFDWVGPVAKTKESSLIDKLGLDAVLFLRFTRMLRNIFLILGLIGLMIMIPINVTQSNKTIAGGLSAFAIMTPLYVWGSGLWAQVVFAWLLDGIVCYFLWHNYRRVLQIRREYLNSHDYQHSLHAHTLMITDIPRQLQSDEGVVRIVDEVNPTGVIPKATVGRNVKILPDLIKEHEELVKRLEHVLAEYLRNPNKLPSTRPRMQAPSTYQGERVEGKVDAIDYLTTRIRELEQKIKQVRERVDMREPLPYGFASFDQVDQAHLVAYAARKKHPQGASVELAPRPNDLIWDNLSLSKSARKGRRFTNGIWVTLLTVLWTPINAAIAIFLSNLYNLGALWPAFQTELETNRRFWEFVQGIASPAITSAVYLVLPIIFRRLQVRAGDITKTSREHHVLRNLFLFFVINNLVVFSLFSAVWQYVSAVVRSHQSGWDALRSGHLFQTIVGSLCGISPFWVTWIVQRNLGAAIDLAQLWSLIYVWFARTFRAPTPRQNIEWTAPPAFDYASYYNYFLFYATVALCFSTLQPIILLVTAMYFTIDCVMKKYLLMYVFVTKTESSGRFWRTLFNRVLFALFLCNVVIAVAVTPNGSWNMLAAMVPLLILLVGFKWYCARTFDDEIKYYARRGMQDPERRGALPKNRQLAHIMSKFGNPALYKRLMTPMVHAKAQPVLAEIYHGRLASEAVASVPFSDIALEPVGPDGKQQAEGPFEIVPEAQQDFAFYRDRADFQEEGGDIYGKAEDVISERSRTPKSFMNQPDLWSAESSRPSSPTPDQMGGVPRKPLPGGILRKPVDPAFRSGNTTRSTTPAHLDREDTDLGARVGPYHHRFDDQARLLGNGGSPAQTPTGSYLSLGQLMSSPSSPEVVKKDDPVSTDYFERGPRR